MAKLKKSLSFKRYLIKGKKEDLLTKQIDGSIIKVSNDEISFHTSKKGLNKLKLAQDANIIIIDRYHGFFKNVILKHLIGIISLIIIFIIMAASNQFIREVVFQDEKMASEEVYQTVNSYLKKFGPFQVLNNNISDISKELRQKYYYFAWIGLTKKGGKLIIEIEKQDVPFIPDDDNIPGNLMALQEGVIKAIFVKTGIVLVGINQTVKKGDLLVTGNLRHLNDEVDLNNWTKATGAIIAKTLSLETVIIPKKVVRNEFSGSVIEKSALSLFNKEVFKNSSPFPDYHKRIISSFGVGFFNIAKIAYYERVEITTIYDESMIEDYVREYLINKFEKNRTHDKELVTLVQIVEQIEEENEFVVKVILGANKNIAYFQPISSSA